MIGHGIRDRGSTNITGGFASLRFTLLVWSAAPAPSTIRPFARLGLHRYALYRIRMLERRSRVLVVDDDTEMCAMLKEYLSKEQFDVALAHDGETALRLVDETAPDIVLLDVSMPSLGG